MRVLNQLFFFVFLFFSLTMSLFIVGPVFLLDEEVTTFSLGEEMKMIRQGRVLAADLENIEARVPILIYHHIRNFSESDSLEAEIFIVTPENFEAQLKYLQENNFTAISFKDLVNYLSGHFIMPKQPIIISFDDGLSSQYANALPLLEKYNFTATFFIFTNPIGRSKNYLTWDQVKELDELGMEIGGHGKYHLFFDRLDSKNQLIEEIFGGKKIIEEELGKSISTIAYPFGSYNGEVMAMVEEAGYESARDIINGVIHTPKDLYHLRGYFVTNNFSRFTRIVGQ